MTDTPKVATLDEIRARLQERKTVDLSKLITFTHAGTDLTFYVGKMNDKGYLAVEVAGITLDETQDWPVIERIKYQALNRRKAYFLHSLLDGDGKRLDEGLIELLLSGDWGAENQRLENAIRQQNPPREQLVDELATVWGKARLDSAYGKWLEKCNLWGRVLTFLTANANDPKEREELEQAAQELNKFNEAYNFFAAEDQLNAAGAAREIGVDVVGQSDK